jgi:putative endonuclease
MQVRVLLAELKAPNSLGLYYFMSYFLYILKSKSAEKYYTGISANPELRLSYHNTFEKGFTSRYRPWEIAFTKEYESKEVAHQMELKIKSWKSKKMIERVIRGEIPV